MTDTATTVVAAAPFVEAIQPYLTALATAIVGAAVTFAARAFSRWTGVQISSSNLDTLRAAASMEAGKAVAAAADNLATVKIDVRSKVVADAADSIANRLPAMVKDSGVTPDVLCQMVAGEIGKLQATMTVATPATQKS